MSESFSFSGDRPLVPNVTVEGNVVWSQDPTEHHISMYQDVSNTTLSDTINDGYVTAEEGNGTQYLSVLDATNEISLENLNISLENPKITDTAELLEHPESIIEPAADDVVDQQVVVYSMEGSDQLFGIQIAQDEDGNIQKYQFQFRKNDDGQLEAIPETIQILPVDEEVDEVQNDQIISEQIAEHDDSTLEDILPEEAGHVQEEYTEETMINYDEDSQSSQVNIDIKPTILQPSLTQLVKQEREEHSTYNELDEQQPEEESPTFHEDQLTTHEPMNFDASVNVEEPQEVDTAVFDQHYEETSNHFIDATALAEIPEELEEQIPDSVNVEYVTEDTQDTQYYEVTQQFVDEESQQYVEDASQFTEDSQETQQYVENSVHIEKATEDSIEDDDNYEHVEVNPDLNLNQEDDSDDDNNEQFINGNDSDNEAYQIVEGLHITGDVEMLEKGNNINILKQALRTPRIKEKKEKLLLYVVQQTEKENVDAQCLNSQFKPIRTNPRSILKSSFHTTFHQIKNEDEGFDERLDKRFARGKEAMQARILHNFINKTTIPQEPVRKKRLPRKQQIKPVDRMDEEIIVQEMMVSSNGFVEADDRFKKGQLEVNWKVTEYVDLIDSDDDYDPKKTSKKKKKNKKGKSKVDVSDSDDSDKVSVIEVHASDDEERNKNRSKETKVTKKKEKSPANISDFSNNSAKRRRGRPKNSSKTNASSTSISETEAPLENQESPSKKPRIDTDISSTKTEIPCPKCTKSFPSQNSLKTHLQHHNLETLQKKNAVAAAAAAAQTESKYKCEKCNSTFKNNALLTRHVCLKGYTCAICKKKLPDPSSFNAHKRTHVKEQLVKSTTVTNMSPRKFKVPKKPSPLKCNHCGKLCSSLQNLSIHMKSHKDYTCTTCRKVFVSRLTLESHVRNNCVKSPHNNRHSARMLNVSSPPKKSTGLKLTCPDCPMQFFTHKALFNHKVVKHNLETPDKSALKQNETRKPLYRAKATHGGVRANERLREAYAKLRSRLVNKTE